MYASDVRSWQRPAERTRRDVSQVEDSENENGDLFEPLKRGRQHIADRVLEDLAYSDNFCIEGYRNSPESSVYENESIPVHAGADTQHIYEPPVPTLNTTFIRKNVQEFNEYFNHILEGLSSNMEPSEADSQRFKDIAQRCTGISQLIKTHNRRKNKRSHSNNHPPPPERNNRDVLMNQEAQTSRAASTCSAAYNTFTKPTAAQAHTTKTTAPAAPKSPRQNRGYAAEGNYGNSDSQISKLYVRLSTRPLNPVDPPGTRYPWTDEVYSILRNVFKIQVFRPLQLDIINTTLKGENVMVLMPTGGGKSLCFQLPALVKSGKTKGTTFVISPLIAPMQDQIAHLEKLDIKAGYMYSKHSAEEKKVIMARLNARDYDIFYFSPERAHISEDIFRLLSDLYHSGELARLVVDEAHCMEMWGYDFRPSYQKIKDLSRQFPGVPVMAITATANRQTQLDVSGIFYNDQNLAIFRTSFNRPNITYSQLSGSIPDNNVLHAIEIIRAKYSGQSGILYCGGRDICERAATALNKYDIRAMPYHAELDERDRSFAQERWQSNQVQVICAIIAFGMGIDKQDVRFVIHIAIPSSLSAFYQESGRVGRDGKPSDNIVYYSREGYLSMISWTYHNKYENMMDINKMLRPLKELGAYCENKTTCCRVALLKYFNEPFDARDCNKTCINCIKKDSYDFLEQNATQITKAIINFFKSSTVNTSISLMVSRFKNWVESAQYKPSAGHFTHSLVMFRLIYGLPVPRLHLG